MLKRLNRACKYFPCHTGLEDCTFCYCPYYPCLDERRGKFVYPDKKMKGVWSCQPCGWIHNKKVVDSLFTLIQKARRPGRNLKGDMTGIIILSHGSKVKKANATLDKIVRSIRQKTGLDSVVPAYFQFCQPDLERSVKVLVSKGHRTIVIIPYFLFNGNHVTRDIPPIIEKVRAKYPERDFVYTRTLGEDTRISDIVRDMIEEVVQSGNANRSTPDRSKEL